MTGALAGGEPGAQMVLDIGEVIVKVEAVHCAGGSGQPIFNETNAKCYADRYPDLKAAFGYNTVQLIQHFQEHGYGEGRIFNCDTGFSEEPRLEAIRFFLSSGRTSRWFGQPLPQGLLAVQVFEGSKQNPIVGLRRAVGRTVSSSFAEVTFTYTDGTSQVPRRSPCLAHPCALCGCADCPAVRAGRTLDLWSWSSSRCRTALSCEAFLEISKSFAQQLLCYKRYFRIQPRQPFAAWSRASNHSTLRCFLFIPRCIVTGRIL